MSGINHNHLYYFWVAAREGGITKASRELLVAQPTVSAQIRQLERSLGRTLLDRSRKRRFALTEDGALVLDYANQIFGYSQEMMQALQAGSLPKTVAFRLGVVSRHV